MKKSFRILLILAAAVMLLASGCACADITDGLIYDETDNTWAAGDEDLSELIAIMKRECAKSPLIKGTYMRYLILPNRGGHYQRKPLLLYSLKQLRLLTLIDWH